MKFKVGDIVIYQGMEVNPEKPHHVGEKAVIFEYRNDGLCKIRFMCDNSEHTCNSDYLENTGFVMPVKNGRIFSDADPYGEEEWDANEAVKTGDYVSYTGWNPDYRGMDGRIEKLDNNDHALLRFNTPPGYHQVVGHTPVHIWVPFDQLHVYKNFDDLIFKEHPDFKSNSEYAKAHKTDRVLAEIAEMKFENGYSISVLFGIAFYSNGKDTYEIMCLDPDGKVLFKHEFGGDEVLGNISSDEVTKWMIKLQKMQKKEKRVYSPEDPYGEEEWETNESVKLDKVIKMVRLDAIYDKYKHHINKHKYIEDELAQYIGMYVQLRAWFSNPDKSYDITPGSKPYMMLNAVYSKEDGMYADCPMVFMDLGDKRGTIHSGFPVNDCLILLVREPVRTFTPEDPYGEEEWDDMTESLFHSDKIKVGDYVRFNKSSKTTAFCEFFDKKICRVLEIYKDRAKVIFDEYVYWNDHGGGSTNWFIPTLNHLEKLTKAELREYKKEKKEKERKKIEQKEKLYLKYKDVDPYGEEQWETNEMRKSKLTPDDYVVKEINVMQVLNDLFFEYQDRYHEAPTGKDMWDDMTEYLNKKLIGKICSFPVLGKDKDGKSEIHGANHWKIDKIYSDENNKIHFVSKGFDVILHISSDPFHRIHYEDKLITSPFDPYGEEEWENESMIKSFHVFRNL